MSNAETTKAWAVLTDTNKIVYINNTRIGSKCIEVPVYGQYSLFETQEAAQRVCDNLNKFYINIYSVHEVELTATVEVTNPSKVSVL